MSIYDKGNEAAKNGMEAALAYYKKNPYMGVGVNKHYSMPIDKGES